MKTYPLLLVVALTALNLHPARPPRKGRVRNGKVTVSKVTPESRRKDIEIIGPIH